MTGQRQERIIGWEQDKVIHDYGLSRKAVIALQEMMGEEWGAARLEAGKRLEISCTAGVLCVSRLRADVASRRNYQDRTVRSANVFCRRSFGALACHAFIDWAVQANGGGAVTALPPHSDGDWLWA
jgi:hypothetical protein